MKTISQFQAQWCAEAVESDLGLWWLADDIREILGPSATESEVRSSTLEALRPLLADGHLHAVDLLPKGKFKEWEGTTSEIVGRIRDEWRALGRRPALGEVVWFIGPRKGPTKKDGGEPTS